MTIEHAVKETLRDWAADATVPPGLATSALRARRIRSRWRRAGAAALVVAAVAIAVPFAGAPHRGPVVVRPAASLNSSGVVSFTIPSWTALPPAQPHLGNTSVMAWPAESPPAHEIAAGSLALSAYNYQATHQHITRYTWYLLDTSTGTYRESPWRQLDVAPGLGFAAVLEGPGATSRIGIVDMATQSIVRWIPVPRPVGVVKFSPDGAYLVATVYQRDPGTFDSGMNGFILLDLATGHGTITRVATPESQYPYEAAQFTQNSGQVFVDGVDPEAMTFYGLDGRRAVAPRYPRAQAVWYGAGISPDGTMTVTDAPGKSSPMTAIGRLGSGAIVGYQPVEDLQGWADNNHLFAWGCDASCHNENHSRLVLVSVDGKSIVPLSGFQTGKTDNSPGEWRLLLTQR